MADYWKSTGKKYCDFCKCWTADNKASIEFHERGKNHQANVKRRLGEIKKNSIEKRKKDEASKKMFDQMEKAALAAVQKDVNSANVSVGRSDLKNIVSANSSSESKRSDTYPWSVMTAPQGFTYYYNALTGESTWNMPEVFKKIQEEERKAQQSESTKVVKSEAKPQKKQVTKDPFRKVEKDEPLRNVHPLLGGWSTVKSFDLGEESESKETKDTVSTNATNPEIEDVKTEVSEENAETERISGKKFKEKVVKTYIASSDEAVSFKKRKTKVRNVRKRDDAD